MSEIQDIDAWIADLYAINNEIPIEYEGKILTFTKRIATKIVFQMKDKSEEDQAFTLIALLSKKPKFTKAQAEMLPHDLVTKILLELDIEGEVKKKLAQKPN